MHHGLKPIQRQQGITFIGLLFIAAIIGILGISVAKTIPSLAEYQAILKAVERAKTGSTVAEVERAFEAAAAIDDIKSIRGKDLTVTKENDKVKIRFAYDKEISLYGPVSLLIHYSGESK